MMNACAVNISGKLFKPSTAMPRPPSRSRYAAPSAPRVAITTGSPPSAFRLYAMLPAQPPHSRRISPIWNDTDSMCVWSGRMCRAKRSGNTMIVS